MFKKGGKMKVIAFNGSPKEAGNTGFAISTVANVLQAEGIEVETIQVGSKVVRGCVACGGCAQNQDERCVFNDDMINECVQKVKAANGVILGSPVYFAGMNGTMKAFLDRLFYVSHTNGRLFRHKVGVSVAAVRRSGGVVTFDELNRFFTISEMLIAGSNYWNVIHGRVPDDAKQDPEGIQCMEVLGKNMAWLIKSTILNAEGAPEKVDKIYTSFVR
jgi:multimeric flavodoxin WrbA